ncbi:GNAT family N-acetyltransferase [Micromonospora okii]|uniref:GNAT family N-acetyltransferase n=1 Tax=Micromonospora okii TaxID=1182970 RepID=UPI001E4F77EB|nr:GNAT family N-acetyltransferase [Micromonospora okii]
MNALPDTVEAEGLRLRPLRAEDVRGVTAACADPLTQQFISGLPNPFTEAHARWLIDKGAPAVRAAGGAVYAVADPETDRLLGGVGLNNPVPARGQADIAYWVVPGARGRGVAAAATRALAATAFAHGMARLELLTHDENTASQRVAMAAGFRHEGVRRAANPTRDGGRHDLICWVRLADDPPGPAPRILPDLPGGRLTDGVVTVRPVGPDDAKGMYRLHRRPEVVANRVPPEPPSLADVERHCRLAGSHWLAGDRADLVIADAGTGELVGGGMLCHGQPGPGQAMIGYSLLPAGRGRGLATRAVRLVVGWAFAEVGLARVWAGTRPENTASQRVLERVGFAREGLMRGWLPGPAGTRVDSVLYGLLATDRPR